MASGSANSDLVLQARAGSATRKTSSAVSAASRAPCEYPSIEEGRGAEHTEFITAPAGIVRRSVSVVEASGGRDEHRTLDSRERPFLHDGIYRCVLLEGCVNYIPRADVSGVPEAVTRGSVQDLLDAEHGQELVYQVLAQQPLMRIQSSGVV